jgi:predicted amidophosphoribosyltransferase
VVQQSILRLKDAGVNIMDAEKVLEEGVDAFDSKSFQEAIVKANAAKEKATQLENKYTETSSLITGWETKVSQIRVNTPEADLTEPETKVYHARLALGRGDHAGVAKSLEGLEPLLEKASKAGMKKGTQELIESTGRMIANIEKRGVILDKKVGAVVDQANFALDQSEYELAQEHCKEAEALVKDTNRLFIKASTAIRQSETRVTDAKGTAKPFGTTEDLLRQARDAMTAGNYSSVTDITGRILGFFGVSASAPTPRKVDWKKEVAIVGGPKAAPATAGPQPASRPATASGQPLPLLEMDFSPDQKDLADKMMKEAAEAIALAREQAVDVSDGEDLLAKARDAYMARRFPEASELSKSAKFLMAELAGAAGAKPRPKMAAPVAAKAPAQAAAPTTAATEPKLSIDKAEALIARLSEMGADVSGLETMLMRSKSARDGGSPVVALQFAKDVLSQGEDLLKQYETAKKNFALAEKVLDVARSRNLDTADAEFQLRQARNAMAGGAFGRVADTATLVLTMLKELDPTLENAAMAAAPAAAMPAPAPAPSTVASPPTQAPAAPATAPPAPAPADTIPCPGCTRPIKPSWKSCPFCGAKIVPAGEKPAAAPAAAPPTVAPPAPAPVPVTAPSTVTPAALSPAPVPAAAPPTMTAAAPASAPLPVAPKAPPVITRPAIIPPAPPSSAGPICPKCRSTVKPHWKVCPSCGSALAPSSPVEPAAAGAAKALADAQRCPACGARITPGMTACPLCKTPLLSDKGARPEPEPPKKVVTVTKPVISPPASAPSAAPRPPAAAPTAAPKPPVAAPPAPPKPLIVPPTPAPAPAAPEKYDAAKKPVLKVVRKKVVVKKKGDEEE